MRPDLILAEVPGRAHIPWLDEPQSLQVIRRWLAAWLCLGCLGLLPAGHALAQEFNRAAELARYRTWLSAFKQDLDQLSAMPGPLSSICTRKMFFLPGKTCTEAERTASCP